MSGIKPREVTQLTNATIGLLLAGTLGTGAAFYQAGWPWGFGAVIGFFAMWVLVVVPLALAIKFWIFQQPTADLKCQTLTANRVLLVDAQGREAFTIGPFLDQATTRSLIVRDLNGKNRLALGLSNDDLVYLNVFDRDGRCVKALGQQELQQQAAPGTSFGGDTGVR